MRPLRGFMADDVPKMMNTLEKGLRIEFDTLGLTVEFEKFEDPLEGRERIRNAEPFDFAIVDLYFDDPDTSSPGDQNGYDLVEDLKAKPQSHTFVVLSTGYVDNDPDFVARARGLGANLALNRGQMRPGKEWNPKALARRIRDHLIDSGSLPVGPVDADPDDPGLSSVLSLLAPTPDRAKLVIRNLMSKCLDWDLGEDFHLELHYLAQGRSGAKVLRVNRSHPAGPDEPYVLKMGLDGKVLNGELLANRRALKALPHDALMPLQGNVERHEQTGFYGVVARMADTDRTLATFLTDATTPDNAIELARVLVDEYLTAMYRSDRSARIMDGSSWILMSDFQRVRTLDSIRQLAGAFSDRRAAGLPDAGEILSSATTFTTDGTIKGAPGPVPKPALHTLSFGDLHSGNILVRSGTQHRPVLIDANEFGVRHWASDIARLVVDVFLRLHRAGVEAMTWDDFPTARLAGSHLCPAAVCLTKSVLYPTTAPAAFIRTVLEISTKAVPFQLHALVTENWHWQWHVALAKELLRQGAHDDVMPARRVLAVTLAHDHLIQAGALLTTLQSS
jgi:CheY-like chemotaxis protein